MKLTDIPTVLRIAQNGVDLTEARKKSEMGGSSLWSRRPWQEKGTTYINVAFQYNMKNGRTVHRYYRVNKAVVEEDIRSIFKGQEYKEGAYPLLALQKEDVVEVQLEKHGDVVKIDGEKMGELLEAYQEALRGMSQEQITDLCPIGTIRFLTEDKKAMLDWEESYKRNGGTNYYYRSYGNKERYPVYECFTDVIALLAEEDSRLSDYIDTEAVEEMILNDRRSYYKNGIWISGEEAKIFKREEIEELAPVLISTEYLSYNEFNFNRELTVDAEVITDDADDEREYERQQFIIKLNDLPEKYVELLSYNETTEAIKTAEDYYD
ncbi:DUF6449 domain-containing protein [Clostridium sp. AM58-1XD]|uniref:DUF6449 domain-containing protein n=1 Tax=Clostridium sp. AM58-1XD TaxID=2292307 RepID=UPI000E505290|nr:DUF6449 domain-containing protein [Clostridium sp. AM58-1XD]RGY99468.1 hypothetical protein DXA13_08175 [Clostridium sp. AM58-1XD]